MNSLSPEVRAAKFSLGLRHYEQQVNDREATSAAPHIDERLLPENAVSHPLAWRKLPLQNVKLFSTSNKDIQPVLPRVTDGSTVLMPVHPLSEHRFQADELIYSGNIQFSASYRTVFFEPEAGGILDNWIPDGKTLMLKLSLEEPLPGIPGDRRLTTEKIEKCVLLSDALPEAIRDDRLARRLNIVPEFFGMSSLEGGVIFRLLPELGVLPVFSLYSSDRTNQDELPMVVKKMQGIFGGDSGKIANKLGEQLATPLVESLLAGFKAGFALEMHGQNTLFSPGENNLIDQVYFRDLEGVVFSNKIRIERGLEPLFPESTNNELIWSGKSMRRWFNRNLDHDLGRVFGCALDTLLRHKVIDSVGKRQAVASIKNAVRQAINSAGLQAIGWQGRILPYSRAPWGNGMRLGHYFRTRYR